jgi:hypothetical protein
MKKNSCSFSGIKEKLKRVFKRGFTLFEYFPSGYNGEGQSKPL